MSNLLPLFQNTVHGLCKSKLTVNARKDIVTDVTVLRDLSECDHFYSRRLPHSPLALLQGWVRSPIHCNITTVTFHLYRPSI